MLISQFLILMFAFSLVIVATEDRVLARCPSLNYIRCADGILCIHKSWMCDGRIDCSDHSDEDEKVCSAKPRHGPLDKSAQHLLQTKKCPKKWFFCMDGSKCVAPRFVCDRKSDCSDGSDEGVFCYGWKALETRKS